MCVSVVRPAGCFIIQVIPVNILSEFRNGWIDTASALAAVNITYSAFFCPLFETSRKNPFFEQNKLKTCAVFSDIKFNSLNVSI